MGRGDIYLISCFLPMVTLDSCRKLDCNEEEEEE
jgi:hypothetical protein